MWGLETGGAQRLIATLARHSPPVRARHAVVSFHAGGSAESLLRAAGCEVIVLPKRPGLDWFLPGRLRALCDRLRPDLVHAHDFTGTFWIRLAFGDRCPFTCVVSDHLAFQKLGRIKRALYVWCLRYADRVVVLSEPTRQGLLAEGVQPDKLVRMWLGPDLDPLPPGVTRESVRGALGLVEDETAILTCARLDEQKNIIWLIRLAARLLRREPSFLFLVAGEGRLRKRLEREVARQGLGKRFRLLGLRRDVSALLAAADIFVLPSRLEEMPVAVLEAMAAGLPVVVSPVGALPELLAASGAGRVLPVSRFEPWEEWVMELAVHPEKRVELGRRGRLFVHHRLDPRQGAHALLGIYEDALARRLGVKS